MSFKGNFKQETSNQNYIREQILKSKFGNLLNEISNDIIEDLSIYSQQSQASITKESEIISGCLDEYFNALNQEKKLLESYKNKDSGLKEKLELINNFKKNFFGCK